MGRHAVSMDLWKDKVIYYCNFFIKPDSFYLLKQTSVVSGVENWEHVLVKSAFVLLGHCYSCLDSKSKFKTKMLSVLLFMGKIIIQKINEKPFFFCKKSAYVTTAITPDMHPYQCFYFLSHCETELV